MLDRALLTRIKLLNGNCAVLALVLRKEMSGDSWDFVATIEADGPDVEKSGEPRMVYRVDWKVRTAEGKPSDATIVEDATRRLSECLTLYGIPHEVTTA